MPETFLEWFFLILIQIGTAVGAIWALAKTILPRWIEAQIESKRDEREFRQQQQNYDVLQKSWERDKLTDILEQNESFIREIISKNLDLMLSNQKTYYDELMKEIIIIKFKSNQILELSENEKK